MTAKVVHCKKEPYDVYIGRGGKWGNPFGLKGTSAKVIVDTREDAIAAFEEWLREQPELMAQVRLELRGKTLGCWCKPKTCHGDVLLRIANE